MILVCDYDLKFWDKASNIEEYIIGSASVVQMLVSLGRTNKEEEEALRTARHYLIFSAWQALMAALNYYKGQIKPEVMAHGKAIAELTSDMPTMYDPSDLSSSSEKKEWQKVKIDSISDLISISNRAFNKENK